MARGTSTLGTEGSIKSFENLCISFEIALSFVDTGKHGIPGRANCAGCTGELPYICSSWMLVNICLSLIHPTHWQKVHMKHRILFKFN